MGIDIAAASAVLSVVAIVFAAVAAAGSWRAARQANATSAAVGRIEADRWHRELTPEFTITGERSGTHPYDRVALRVQLTGPPGLDHLDDVRLEILDDGPRRLPGAGGHTQTDLDQVIWGPYQFAPGADRVCDNGRRVAAFPLRVADRKPLALTRSTNPPWTPGGSWNDTYRDSTIRLQLTCQKEGHRPWVVARELDQSSLNGPADGTPPAS